MELDDVLTAVRSGSEPAFARLVDRYRRELHLHCYRMGGSFDEAEEVLQEALLKVWRARQSLPAAGGVRPWLYRVVTNTCIDDARRRARRVRPLSSFEEMPWLQPYPDGLLNQALPADAEPESVVVARETISLAFLAVIQTLPAKQRAVLILRDVLGWSAAECASLLDASVPAVNSALQRARTTMRDHHARRTTASLPSPATEDEQALLKRYIEAHEQGDAAGLAAIMAEDVRVTMPPAPFRYEGRAALAPLLARAFGPDGDGDWLAVATRANRQPAAACYLRRPGDSQYRAFKLDVLRIENGTIAETTTFGNGQFPAFDLPTTLEPRRS
ncbi:RNA polymerase subunit sigma-70 [Actinoallomurus iriomotensis]|uniref:RNA polymerase sigma factor n=1 Tax=Actinoallomurus iriomotensis TaxID=478107 RepID=A0A9W6VN93_9ACTN|nr:RNA polymerase subunit sigma-70 [Actinoallomurus iriomotensis]GLY72306.1 RNA polymerase sigma factor [Actinoallomurus iriomotensis]